MFLVHIAMDDKDRHGLEREKWGLLFTFNVMPA